MPASAPRLDPRLIAALEQLLKDESVPVAELNRRLGAVADALSLTKPSYERVRLIVNDRRSGSLGMPTAGQVLLEIAARSRPADDLLKLLTDPAALRAK
ncbi:MAG: hypothetical protein M3R12_01215 [Actinomycetota bacterium]|nr:hypothetical protein [Actinomycetota bacterium]